jgi:hypothetical protein
MKYVATCTKSVRDPHTAKVHKITKGDVVSEIRAKKFGLANFTPLSSVKAERYTKAEAELLAKLYLELDADYKQVVQQFVEQTNSKSARVGSVQCMVRRMHHVDNYFQGAEVGVPASDHQDFGRVYAALLSQSANPVRFI